jgi:hypothetical protein
VAYLIVGLLAVPVVVVAVIVSVYVHCWLERRRGVTSWDPPTDERRGGGKLFAPVDERDHGKVRR